MRTIQDFKRLNRNPFDGDSLIIPSSPMTQVKDVDAKKGIVTMYWSAFGNVDSYREVIMPGAFSKTIREWGPAGRKRIRHLMDHNPTHRIGVPQHIEEDSHGLLAVSKILGQDHSKGRDALIEYEEGAITEHSIGFRLIKWEADQNEDLLMLTEIALYEGSGVSWGANQETPTIDVKALRQDPLLLETMVRQIQAIERCLRREVTDEFAIELEERLTSFKRVTSELDKALRKEFNLSEPQPQGPESTLNDAEPQIPTEAEKLRAMAVILGSINRN